MKWFRCARGNRRWVAAHRRADDQRRKTYRPRLDALEARLPPSDVLLGAALGSSWFASGLWLLKANPLPAALASTEELPTDHQQGYAGSLSALAVDLPSPAPASALAPLRFQPEPKRFFEVPIQGPLPEDLNSSP